MLVIDHNLNNTDYLTHRTEIKGELHRIPEADKFNTKGSATPREKYLIKRFSNYLTNTHYYNPDYINYVGTKLDIHPISSKIRSKELQLIVRDFDFRFLTNEIIPQVKQRAPTLGYGYIDDQYASLVLFNMINLHTPLWSKLLTMTINDILDRLCFNHDLNEYVLEDYGAIHGIEDKIRLPEGVNINFNPIHSTFPHPHLPRQLEANKALHHRIISLYDESRSDQYSIQLDHSRLENEILLPLLEQDRESQVGLYFFKRPYWFSKAFHHVVQRIKLITDEICNFIKWFRINERTTATIPVMDMLLQPNPYVLYNLGFHLPSKRGIILRPDEHAKGDTQIRVPQDPDTDLMEWFQKNDIHHPLDKELFIKTLLYYHHPIIYSHVNKHIQDATIIAFTYMTTTNTIGTRSSYHSPPGLTRQSPTDHTITDDNNMELILDTGCNQHMFNTVPTFLNNKKLLIHKQAILLGGDRAHTLYSTGKFSAGSLKSILLVPSLTRNLISGPRLMEAGFKISLLPNMTTEIIYNNEIISRGHVTENKLIQLSDNNLLYFNKQLYTQHQPSIQYTRHIHQHPIPSLAYHQEESNIPVSNNRFAPLYVDDNDDN